MAFRRKQSLIDLLQPDVLILQEVSRRDLESLDAPFCHWVGANESKGLGVVVYRDDPCSITSPYQAELPWFIPFSVGEVRILASWACSISYRRQYVRLMHEAVDHYRAYLTSPTSMVIGDFNSNQIFDRKYRADNHSGLVDKLGTMGMISLYHRSTGEAHGNETVPTYYQYRRLTMPYHFDFAFATEGLATCSSLAIGTAGRWLPMSDHMPLIIDLDEQ
jgi:endonuclease/exonuclease/phosphatase family metal-dependent hydrolase